MSAYGELQVEKTDLRTLSPLRAPTGFETIMVVACQSSSSSGSSSNAKASSQWCVYCKRSGHLNDACQKLQRKRASGHPSASHPFSPSVAMDAPKGSSTNSFTSVRDDNVAQLAKQFQQVHLVLHCLISGSGDAPLTAMSIAFGTNKSLWVGDYGATYHMPPDGSILTYYTNTHSFKICTADGTTVHITQRRSIIPVQTWWSLVSF